MRHMGAILDEAALAKQDVCAAGLPSAPPDALLPVAWACCLPKWDSPSGQALRECFVALRELGCTHDEDCIALAAARAFAAKGASVSADSAIAQAALAEWRKTGHSPPKDRAELTAIGMGEAMKSSIHGHRAGGLTQDWEMTRIRVKEVLREVAHVQTVRGGETAEFQLLVTLFSLGLQNASYRCLSLQALMRAGAVIVSGQ